MMGLVADDDVVKGQGGHGSSFRAQTGHLMTDFLAVSPFQLCHRSPPGRRLPERRTSRGQTAMPG